MYKLVCASVFVLFLLLQLQQPAEAYKIIAYNYQALPVSTPVVTAVTTTAVPVQDIQAITDSIVNAKINIFSTLVNTALQFKQSLLQSYANGLNSVQTVQPVVYTKSYQPVTYTKTYQPVTYTKTIQPIVYTKSIQPAVFSKTIYLG